MSKQERFVRPAVFFHLLFISMFFLGAIFVLPAFLKGKKLEKKTGALVVAKKDGKNGKPGGLL